MTSETYYHNALSIAFSYDYDSETWLIKEELAKTEAVWTESE